MSGYVYVGTANYKPNELYVFYGRTHAEGPNNNIQINIQLFRPFDGTDGDWSSLDGNVLFEANCFLFGATVNYKAYLFGGVTQQGWDNPASGSRFTQAVEFTPYSSWAGRNPLAVARSHAGSFALGNNVFIAGGYTNSIAGDTVRYNTVADSYVTGYASMVNARQNFACFAGNNYGWAIGGWTGSNYLNTVEKFDDPGASWSVALTGPFSGRDKVRGGCATGGKGSIFGGKVSGGAFLNQILILDTVAQTISTSARTLIIPVVDMAAAGLLDKVYAVSGQIKNNGTYRDVTRHDPLTDSVATMEKIEDFRRNGALALTI
jgi:hypothetical protein